MPGLANGGRLAEAKAEPQIPSAQNLAVVAASWRAAMLGEIATLSMRY